MKFRKKQYEEQKPLTKIADVWVINKGLHNERNFVGSLQQLIQVEHNITSIKKLGSARVYIGD